MKKVPSLKRLLFAILFSSVIFFSNSCFSWAYLLDVAKEYLFKADNLKSQGKLEQAIEYYQKAIGLDKYSAAAYNGLAICYEKKGWFDRAEEEYLRVLGINPQYAPAHYNLGLLYERRGEIKKALFHWKQRFRLGHPGSQGRLKTQAKLKKYAPQELKKEQARELAQNIAEQKEKQPLDEILGRNKYKTREEKIQDYYLKGMQSFQEGDFQKTQEYFHKMVEVVPFSN